MRSGSLLFWKKRVRAGQFVAMLAAGVAALAGGALAQPSPMPAEARVYILWPPDGQRIKGPTFWVRMGLSGAGVAPAGVDIAHTGHHHLLIDVPLPEDMTAPIVNGRNHLHFGLGQTETQLELPPGRHTLQMLLGDGQHIPHDPPLYSKQITVTVLP